MAACVALQAAGLADYFPRISQSNQAHQGVPRREGVRSFTFPPLFVQWGKIDFVYVIAAMPGQNAGTA